MVWYESAFEWVSSFFSKIVVAVIILLIGFIVGKVLGKLVQKGLKDLEVDKVLRKSGLRVGIEDILSRFAEFFIYFIAIIYVLNQLGLTITILYIIAAFVLLIMTASFILGIKDFIPNLIAGIVLHRKNFIKEGKRIKVNGMQGKIIAFTLLETRIKTKKGDVIYIPNSYITKSKVVIKGKA